MATPEAPIAHTHAAADASVSHHRAENRLPSTVKAVHYAVELTPHLSKATFDGKINITLNLAEATQTLLMNAVELTLHDARVVHSNGSSFVSSSIELDEKDEIATLKFSETIPAGTINLHINFNGILNDQLRGFYLSQYEDSNGAKQTLATTQFEATDCRRAMPCIDEPAAKATFAVTLICESEYVALSNMPEKASSKLESGLSKHEFETTPIMSTYLLAFVVGKFDCIESHTNDAQRTLVRCYATPGKGEHGRFALDLAVKLLPFYNEWFDEPYPLPKLDMIAIPDFAAGAMENWGLITYRETALLLDPATSSSKTKQWIAVCVAHEIAHQWFGNLVTMEWWTHLWLNEGFATWMENYAVDHFFPEWGMWKQFVYSDLNSAFDLDSLESSHPIEVPIYHASETDEIFDTISYCKGCVAIRMLESFLGQEDFRKGLVTYIKKFKYGNAFTEDLWSVLSEVSGKDVKGMMQSWTKHTGFPLLTIKEEDIKYTDKGFILQASQARFLQDGPDRSSSVTWPIPVNFLIDGQSKPLPNNHQVFGASAGGLSVDFASAGLAANARPAWFKLNANQAAMYRVVYPVSVFKGLCDAIKKGDQLLSPTDRLGFQADAFALTRCGLISTTQLLELVQSYENERDYTVWADLCSNLSDLAILFGSDEKVFAKFSKYVLRLISKILAQVGWEKAVNEEHTTTLLRVKILGVAAAYGEPNTVQTALKKFAAFIASGAALAKEGSSASSSSVSVAAADSNQIAPDLREIVYDLSVKHGGLLGYEQMLLLLEKGSTLSEEKERYQDALCVSKEATLIFRTLEMILSPAVRVQDGSSMIYAVSSSSYQARQICWEFCKIHWEAIVKKFQQSSSLSRVVKQCANFASVELKNDVEKFFEEHAHPGAERAVKQAIERIASNAEWAKRDFNAASQWLNSNVA